MSYPQAKALIPKGKGWYQAMQDAIADGHFTKYENSTDKGQIKLLNGWRGNMSEKILVFDNGLTLATIHGTVQAPTSKINSGTIVQIASLPSDADMWIGTLNFGMGDPNWFDMHSAFISNARVLVKADRDINANSWYSLSGFSL